MPVQSPHDTWRTDRGMGEHTGIWGHRHKGHTHVWTPPLRHTNMPDNPLHACQ